MKTRTSTVIITCVAFLAVAVVTSTAFSRAGGKHDKVKRILSKSDEVFETEKQIHKATTRHRLEAAKLLTKEQRAKLMKSRHSKQNRHGKERGFRGMRRDGDDDDRKRMRHRGRDHHRFSREDIIKEFGFSREDIIKKFDEDGDGKLSREERQNVAKSFSSREHKKGNNRHRFSREDIIKKFDEDGDDDGDLSHEERQNAAESMGNERQRISNRRNH